MSQNRRDQLLDKEWSAVWGSLSEAPDFVRRPKTAQISLHLSTSVLNRLKRAAIARSSTRHALARAWIVDGLRDGRRPEEAAVTAEPPAAQLHVKLDQDVLDQLKTNAARLRLPYHRLARNWIEVALRREEQRLGLASNSEESHF